jgi:ATP-binding cassette subfamily B protein
MGGIQHAAEEWMQPGDDDEVLGKAYDARLMRRLLRYMRPYRASVFAAIGLLGAISALELVGPLLTRAAIDHFIAQGDFAGLGGISALYLLVLVSVFGLRYLQTYLLNRSGQHAMHDLRVELFTHVQRQSLSFFDRNPVGRLLTRLTNDVEALNEMLTSGVVAIISDLAIVVGIAVVLLVLEWRLALLILAVMPALVLFTELLRRRMRDSFRAVRVRLARLNAYLAENISGMQIVQFFNRQTRHFDEFDRLNRDHLRATLQSVRYHSMFYPSVGVVNAVAVGLIIWYGGGQVVQAALTLGTLVAFIQYLERLFQPIRDLSEKYSIMQAAMAASERIFQLLDQTTELPVPSHPRRLEAARSQIEFRHVWFAYENDNWVLKDVSFTIRPGERVAIVGATGAGKTSIINLASRFYDPQRGQVLIDGIDVREVEPAELRRHVGVVLQDPFLFAGSVERNIRLQEARISEADVRRAAELVNAHTFVERLPDGYQQELHERGAGLSTGQKQLLAFARAVAFDPQILLVLDEATSNIDTETEALIQQALERLMEGRTSVVIAHRLSTIRKADRILVLHKGQLVEEGPHEALVRRGGIYSRLHELQYLGEDAVVR